MERLSYVLKTPTLAILTVEGERIPVTIPRNGVVAVIDENDPRPMIDVEWEGNRMLMFAIDLRDRGRPIRSAGVQAQLHRVQRNQ